MFIFGDGRHVAAHARIARDEMGFEVVGIGCYNREMAHPIFALAADYPGLEIAVHASAEWAVTDGALEAAKAAIADVDIVIANMLFLEEHVQAKRDQCDAMAAMIAGGDVVELTRIGDLDTMKPASGAMTLLKKLRGKGKADSGSGAK